MAMDSYFQMGCYDDFLIKAARVGKYHESGPRPNTTDRTLRKGAIV